MLSLVLPVYNEEEIIRDSHKKLVAELNTLNMPYEMIFVNDGSRDKSADIIAELIEHNKNTKLINFSRNFGQQMAVTAGIAAASGDAIVTIDADLQDPPALIKDMLAKWREGYEIVYTRRKKRDGETAFKKLSAWGFYFVINKMTNNSIPRDVGDFRLIDKRVATVINNMDERNRYLRGMISWVGYKSCIIEYNRDARTGGKTKYNLKRMLALAADAIIAYSYAPMRLIAKTGTLLKIGGAAYLLGTGIAKLFTRAQVFNHVILSTVILMSGLIMLSISLAGEYIIRICDEVRGRPLYIINNKLGFDDKEE